MNIVCVYALKLVAVLCKLQQNVLVGRGGGRKRLAWVQLSSHGIHVRLYPPNMGGSDPPSAEAYAIGPYRAVGRCYTVPRGYVTDMASMGGVGGVVGWRGCTVVVRSHHL